jgi:hypothetical protein
MLYKGPSCLAVMHACVLPALIVFRDAQCVREILTLSFLSMLEHPDLTLWELEWAKFYFSLNKVIYFVQFCFGEPVHASILYMLFHGVNAYLGLVTKRIISED